MPHERSLVARYKDRPFALLGVDADETNGPGKELEAKGQITWRNWLDSDGAICQRWQVEAFPVVYVLDSRGVIRFKEIGPRQKDLEEMEAVIDKCLQQAGQVARGGP